MGGPALMFKVETLLVCQFAGTAESFYQKLAMTDLLQSLDACLIAQGLIPSGSVQEDLLLQELHVILNARMVSK